MTKEKPPSFEGGSHDTAIKKKEVVTIPEGFQIFTNNQFVFASNSHLAVLASAPWDRRA